MKLIFSLFAQKIVNEELELIQKALVMAHNHYVSCSNFEDALKITKILSENQNEDGCFIFNRLSENSYKFLNSYVSPINGIVCINLLLNPAVG